MRDKEEKGCVKKGKRGRVVSCPIIKGCDLAIYEPGSKYTWGLFTQTNYVYLLCAFQAVSVEYISLKVSNVVSNNFVIAISVY